ncbi:MAG: DUF3108 domain-containing protein [Hymenobacteraceae bacterium]|nr:DUF3108 domain-containing protein [Hymenobacteraceae bacterium]MDX5396418.1 DUF3108 domain-containing protein [Hymenobacteraceae bacterium]MDX5442156.1 DUF3108 domain-containing protein [Hymenobacteraceae bacterium]MDX5512479.1 DUF3108 domain-containing protein [Hymenobacteraceae bacterium]
MLKKLFPLLIIVALVVSGFVAKNTMRSIPNESFSTGEVLKYKVHYGYVNAAEAVIDIAPAVHKINDRPCYKVNVFGKTTGSFDFFLRIRDNWSSFIDTSAIVPHRFVRDIEEGKYRKKEITHFDHYRNTALVEDKKKKENGGTYNVPDNVQDLVSGFYYLRTINFDRYKPGDIIKVPGFLDDEVFDMSVRYMGSETVETKAGKFRAIRLVPKMPSNKLFSGEDAISVYLSDDRNKIPVLIKAEMFVGSVKVDLYDYKGLKHNLELAKR